MYPKGFAELFVNFKFFSMSIESGFSSAATLRASMIDPEVPETEEEELFTFLPPIPRNLLIIYSVGIMIWVVIWIYAIYAAVKALPVIIMLIPEQHSNQIPTFCIRY
jgi:hypothetical protein